MTRHTLGWAVLCWMLLPGCLAAQERELRGMVVRLGAHDEKVPEVNLTVTIKEGSCWIPGSWMCRWRTT